MIVNSAEFVLRGHPDKVCDRIADLLVDLAIGRDPMALVGVEVAIHQRRVFVTGCITTEPAVTHDEVVKIVHLGLSQSGYGERWSPLHQEVEVLTDLRLEALDDELRHLRGVSDDQAICVGYAGGRREHRYLPAAHRLVWLAAQEMEQILAEAGLGPDGKVIIFESDGVVQHMSLSLHHKEGFARKKLWEVATRVAAVVGVSDLDRVEVNGGGDFSVGGSFGDNGLSGKKLVVDAYGPTVPIGGGAWSGKDPHKVDRVGALRARELALRVVRRGLGKEALVTIGWQPGDEVPVHTQLLVDGQVRDLAILGPADLSIEGTWRELKLGNIQYADFADGGWFQRAVS